MSLLPIMENDKFKDESEPQEIFEPFDCCVCLDLLYKPIVLSCGHISCFWCVHNSMSGIRESHCPICRHPYYHFPTICQMLHFLLLKIYPDAYKRRESQTFEEEGKMRYFSPQFNAYTFGSQDTFEDLGRSPSHTIESFECMEQSGSSTLKGGEGTAIYSKHTSTRTLEVIRTPDEGKMFPQNEHNQKKKLMADVTCPTCKELLFHPVVLNCGHVFCETCVINISEGMLKCQVCQSPHPRGLPKVCLALDHFLEEQFPEEYAQRRDEIRLKQTKVEPDVETTSCSLLNGEGDTIAWRFHPGYKVHFGVGCDFCGMYPITGDRYKCLDCKEESGFDLCGDCYKTRSKLPGRFNQQHGPEHRFELQGQQNRVVWREYYEEEPQENFVNIADDPSSTDEEDDQNDSEATN